MPPQPAQTLPPSPTSLGPAEADRLYADLERAASDLPFFCARYCQVLSSTESGDWIPFRLWPSQLGAAELLDSPARRIIILKARQLGITWLMAALVLRHMLCEPIATVLLFSKTDLDAKDFLRDKIMEMMRRLPPELQSRQLPTDNAHEVQLENGSRVLSFSTAGGRSMTGTLAVIDEADWIKEPPGLRGMLNSVKATIAGGGRLVLVSSSDKSKPESRFKNIYRAAKQGANHYAPLFIGWDARPDRDAAWYARESQDGLAESGGLDDIHQEFPSKDTEALAPRSEDKRIPAAWLHECYAECGPVEVRGAPALPALVVYDPPVPGRLYVVGGDPAEGNPTSDDSAACVLDAETGEQVAELAGKLEPAAFASALAQLSKWYNGAAVMCERNNHGHAVLLWLRNFAPKVRRLEGHDGKEGWMSSALGKTSLYDKAADAFKNAELLIHSFGAFVQLSSIEGNTLRAPEGQHDDRADACALAVAGRAEALRLARGSGWLSPKQLRERAAERRAQERHPEFQGPPNAARIAALAKRFGLTVPD
jgi:hypothetical protein